MREQGGDVNIGGGCNFGHRRIGIALLFEQAARRFGQTKSRFLFAFSRRKSLHRVNRRFGPRFWGGSFQVWRMRAFAVIHFSPYVGYAI